MRYFFEGERERQSSRGSLRLERAREGIAIGEATITTNCCVPHRQDGRSTSEPSAQDAQHPRARTPVTSPLGLEQVGWKGR